MYQTSELVIKIKKMYEECEIHGLRTCQGKIIILF